MSSSLNGYQGMGQSNRGPTGSSSGLKGTGYQQVTAQSFTPEQMQLFQRMFSQVSPDSQLSKLAGGDQSQFDQLEAPALKQFSALQGNLASRFSGMGSGARRSSGFQNASNQAAQDFAGQLQSQRMGLQRQAMQDLMGFSSNLLQQRPYEEYILPQQKPFWQELLLGLAPGIGQGAGAAGTSAAFSKFAPMAAAAL